MAPNILTSSLQNASFNIIFQIMLRCVTFCLNAFVVRHVGEATLGVMNVRLLLLESIILFLSKEPFMKACLTNTADHNWAQVVNLLWITVPICFVISLVSGYVWLHFLPVSEELPIYYEFGVWAVAVSCVIELSSLVVELVASAFLFVKLRIILETIKIGLRTIIFILFILQNPKNAVLAFGVAQLAAAVFYTVSQYLYFHYYIKRVKKRKLKRRLSRTDDGTEEFVMSEFPFKSIKDFLPGQLSNKDYVVDKNLSILTWTFFKQGFLKQVLTEGERMIMTFLPVLNLTEQGTYEVVNNLGSLAARFIFRPIEESSYFYFTQMIKRDEPIHRQNPSKIQESVVVLGHLCYLVTSIGLLVLVFGYSYSSLLLWLYGGVRFTVPLPVLLMRAHCLAVLLLGINGVTEGFTNATADSITINKHNRIMILESIVFLLASFIFVKIFGPVGFILGNCVNMGLRIMLSMKYIRKRYFQTDHQPLQGLYPKKLFSLMLVSAALVTNASHMYFFPDYKLYHFAIGAITFLIVLLSWLYENSGLLKIAVIKYYEWKSSRVKDE